jgi:hypothetical protein
MDDDNNGISGSNGKKEHHDMDIMSAHTKNSNRVLIKACN